MIRKESLEPPRRQQRSLSDLQICKLAQMVVVAMACISAAKIVPSEAKFLTFLLCGIMCLAQANMWTNP